MDSMKPLTGCGSASADPPAHTPLLEWVSVSVFQFNFLGSSYTYRLRF